MKISTDFLFREYDFPIIVHPSLLTEFEDFVQKIKQNKTN